MLEVVWSTQARRDVDDIWDYYAENGGEPLADSIVDRIYRRCELLRRFPDQGAPCDELLPQSRFVVAGPHLVIYRHREHDVEIVHVLHGRQDREAFFHTIQ